MIIELSMKLQHPKEPHVVFLVSDQCEISFIWRDILTDIPAQQRQMAITRYIVSILLIRSV